MIFFVKFREQQSMTYYKWNRPLPMEGKIFKWIKTVLDDMKDQYVINYWGCSGKIKVQNKINDLIFPFSVLEDILLNYYRNLKKN